MKIHCNFNADEANGNCYGPAAELGGSVRESLGTGLGTAVASSIGAAVASSIGAAVGSSIGLADKLSVTLMVDKIDGLIVGL